MPTASSRPRTNATPKRRASDRRRRGRAGGLPSVTAAATGWTGTASTSSKSGEVESAEAEVTSNTGSVASAPALGVESPAEAPASDAWAVSSAAGAPATGDTSRRTSAASSGSPAGVSPSGVEALAARSAAELGRSVIRCSCGVGRCRARPGQPRHLRACRRICHATVCSADGTGTREAPRTFRRRTTTRRFGLLADGLRCHAGPVPERDVVAAAFASRPSPRTGDRSADCILASSLVRGRKMEPARSAAPHTW